ncbi:hypothetical protein HID58_061704 [Brassica napus]|uniref:Uncharacterized protein n=1 Tax=Brassica napus TaxID=3708 RepID=A0ABQ8A057_BRANA|nr:hypothetical protein HID58_061704 [Brassica napus]
MEELQLELKWGNKYSVYTFLYTSVELPYYVYFDSLKGSNKPSPGLR